MDEKQVKGRERSPCQAECQLLPGQVRRSLALSPGGCWRDAESVKERDCLVGLREKSLGVKTNKAAGNCKR